MKLNKERVRLMTNNRDEIAQQFWSNALRQAAQCNELNMIMRCFINVVDFVCRIRYLHDLEKQCQLIDMEMPNSITIVHQHVNEVLERLEASVEELQHAEIPSLCAGYLRQIWEHVNDNHRFICENIPPAIADRWQSAVNSLCEIVNRVERAEAHTLGQLPNVLQGISQGMDIENFRP
jgi:phage host-nuclease inhibitor protein Gam